jgi:CheY-like chemotaxis protein
MSAPTALTGKHILVIDDDPDNLELLDFLLQEEGAIVTAIGSSLHALDFVTQNSIDALISDIGMPELGGHELLRRIRALPQYQSLPALALTAFARTEDRTAAIAAGFQAYITKPVDLTEFLAALTQLLET